MGVHGKKRMGMFEHEHIRCGKQAGYTEELLGNEEILKMKILFWAFSYIYARRKHDDCFWAGTV